MQKNLLLIFIAAAAISGGVLLFLAPDRAAQADNPGDRNFSVIENIEEPFPPLTLKNMKGEDVDLLKAHPSKTLLVNYWATWCPPCITEIPSLLAPKARRRSAIFDVVFVSLDFPKSPEDLSKLMERNGLGGLEGFDTLYMTDARQWSSLKGRGLPITVLVSPEGVIMSRMTGGIEWTGPMADDFLKNVR